MFVTGMLEQENNSARESRTFIGQSVLAVIILSLVVLCFSALAQVAGLVAPLIVSAAFALIETAVALLWHRVARGGSVDAIATLLSSVSGFRMLLALLTLAGCYVAVGRDGIMNYLLVFFLFYFWIIAHHSIFFSRMSKIHTRCDNEKNK